MLEHLKNELKPTYYHTTQNDNITVDYINDCAPEPKGFPKHYCPYCGESYYRENYVTSTAIYFPPIYKDGVNINLDRNQTSTHCTCMVCGKDFVY